MLQSCVNVGEAVDKAVAEGKDKFERLLSFLSENEELGEVSCTVSLTIGRLWPKVKDKRFFQKIKVINEYDETIAILRKRLQNWDQLDPTRAQLISSFLDVPRNLMSELKTNLQVLENAVDEKTLRNPG